MNDVTTPSVTIRPYNYQRCTLPLKKIINDFILRLLYLGVRDCICVKGDDAHCPEYI